MNKQIVIHDEIKLVGIMVRTKNQNEFNSETAKIGALVSRYWQENIAEKIPDRKNPGITLVSYAHYESDEHGEYDYYLGEQVTSITNVPSGFSSVVIPAGRFLKITSDGGKMPEININLWKNIWTETRDNILGAKRKYLCDFEIYDQRASDPNHTVFDIYLGIE